MLRLIFVMLVVYVSNKELIRVLRLVFVVLVNLCAFTLIKMCTNC